MAASLFFMNRNLFLLFSTFIKLGSLSFGGYMSLIAMVREELVTKKKLINDEIITEGTALASILPGPVAVNVVVYVGYRMNGLMGSLISMVAVLLPSFVLVLLLTVLYLQWSTKIAFDSVVRGVLPVVSAIILSVGYTMGKANCKRPIHYLAAGISCLILILFPGNYTIILVLSAAAFLGVLFFNKQDYKKMPMESSDWSGFIIFIIAVVIGMVISVTFFRDNSIVQLFSKFSMVSLTLFGGGYVMVPVLQSMLVDHLHWTSQQEFIYGVSIGQITPGPILISAAFFGYKVSGIPGSVVATIGIFLPSAILMITLSKVYLVIKGNAYVQSGLEMIKPAIVGLILYSGVLLIGAETSGTHFLPILILLAVSLILIFWLKFKPFLMIPAGACIGYFLL